MQEYQTQLIQFMYPRNTLIDYFMDFVNQDHLKDKAQDMYRFYIFSEFFLEAKLKGIKDLHMAMASAVLTVMQNVEGGMIQSEAATLLTDVIHVTGFEDIEPIFWVLQNCPRNQMYFRNPEDRRIVSALTYQFLLYNGVFKKLQMFLKNLLQKDLLRAFADISSMRRRIIFQILDSIGRYRFQEIDAVHICDAFQQFDYSPDAVVAFSHGKKENIGALFRYVLIFKVFIWVFYSFIRRATNLSQNQALFAMSGCLSFLLTQFKEPFTNESQIYLSLDIDSNSSLHEEYRSQVTQIVDKVSCSQKQLISLKILRTQNYEGMDSILHSRVLHLNLFRLTELLKTIVNPNEISPLIFLNYYNEEPVISEPDSIYVKKRHQIYQKQIPNIDIPKGASGLVNPKTFARYGASMSPRQNIAQKTTTELNLDLSQQFNTLLGLTADSYFLECILAQGKFKEIVNALQEKVSENLPAQILKRNLDKLPLFLEYALQRTILSFISLNHLNKAKTTELLNGICTREEFSNSVLICCVLLIRGLSDQFQETEDTRIIIRQVFTCLEGSMLRFIKILPYFLDGLLGKVNPILLRRLRKIEDKIVHSLIWEDPDYRLWDFFHSQLETNATARESEKKTGIHYELHKHLCTRMLSLSALKFDSTLKKLDLSTAQQNCIWNLFRMILATKPQQVVQSNLICLQICCLLLGTRMFSQEQETNLKLFTIPKEVKIRLTRDPNPRTIVIKFKNYFNKVFLGYNKEVIQKVTKAINRNPSLSPYGGNRVKSEEDGSMDLSKNISNKIIESSLPYCRILYNEERTIYDQLKEADNCKYKVQFELVERLARELKGLDARHQNFPLEIHTSELEYRFGETPNSQLIQLQNYIEKNVGADHLDDPMQKSNLSLLRGLENEKSGDSLLVPRVSSSRASEDQAFL